MARQTSAFSFVHGDLTFACQVEGERSSARGPWWWFTVSSEAHQRHAPFPADAGDTRDDVRARIIAYYEHRQARRAEPAQSRWQQRGARPAAPAAPATPQA